MACCLGRFPGTSSARYLAQPAPPAPGSAWAVEGQRHKQQNQVPQVTTSQLCSLPGSPEVQHWGEGHLTSSRALKVTCEVPQRQQVQLPQPRSLCPTAAPSSEVVPALPSPCPQDVQLGQNAVTQPGPAQPAKPSSGRPHLPGSPAQGFEVKVKGPSCLPLQMDHLLGILSLPGPWGQSQTPAAQALGHSPPAGQASHWVCPGAPRPGTPMWLPNSPHTWSKGSHTTTPPRPHPPRTASRSGSGMTSWEDPWQCCD